MKEILVEGGTLLAAAPDLLDPNFMHAVVLMCDHTPQAAMGIVINRPTDRTIDALLPEHPVLAAQRFPVHLGGPVGRDTLQFLHRAGDEIPGGIELVEGLWLGGELEAMAGFLARRRREAGQAIRLFVGYSGWGPRQLEGELATGSWLPATLRHDWIFEEDPLATWRRVVQSLGRDIGGLADLPPDASWN